MKKSIFNTCLLFIFINIYSNAQPYSKGAICQGLIFNAEKDSDSHIIKFEQATVANKGMTMFVAQPLLLNKKGVYYDNHLPWEVFDSLLFVIFLFEDQYPLNYSQMKMYNISQIKKHFNSGADNLLNYTIDTKNIKSKPVGPLDSYSFDNVFNRDTARYGKINFDIVCDQNEFNLVIHFESTDSIEVWAFTRYPILTRGTDVDKKLRDEIYKLKPWELLATVPVKRPFSGAFHAIRTQGQNYLVTQSGEIYRIGATQLEFVETLPQGPDRTLIIDKDRDEVYHIERALLLRDDGKPLREKLRESAVQILTDH